MEDVLSVYTRPYDLTHPLGCMDEINTQLLADTREPLPLEPGKTRCEEYEYEHHGGCNVCLACQPMVGSRVTMTAPHRTKQEWEEFVRRLAEEQYSPAEKIVLILDNLNTHTLAALSEVFLVAQARRLCQRFEVHSTPKHGRWLNRAELELSALDRQCSLHRLVSFEQAEQQVAAWTTRRNQQQATIQWRFPAEDATINLKQLSPSINY